MQVNKVLVVIMKISVITVCFNAVEILEKTILSVFNQTYNDVEYIVIDGGSTDGTVEIIEKYSNRLAYWISEPDKGIYDAINKGLTMATGDWVSFMNAGDCFYNYLVLDDIFGNIKTTAIAIYGDAQYIFPDEIKICKAKEAYFIKRNMPITHQSFFMRTIYAKELLFRLKYKYVADYDMIYRLYILYGKTAFMYLPIVICEYEACSGLTVKNKTKVMREVLEVRNFSIEWVSDYLKYLLMSFSPKIFNYLYRIYAKIIG